MHDVNELIRDIRALSMLSSQMGKVWWKLNPIAGADRYR